MFDLSKMLESVSDLDTKEQITYVDIDLIDANDDNFYDVSSIGSLCDSIAISGLQQPLVVMPIEGSDHYTLISGHRRRAALLRLICDVDHPREDLSSVPCLVRKYQSKAMAELELILANSTTRVLTSAETMRQAERMEMLLYELKEEGFTFPGRMRDHVAEACKTSASKLARLKVIRNQLVPQLMERFEKDTLSEQAAYALARVPEDVQLAVDATLGDKHTISGWRADKLIKDLDDLRKLTACPHGAPNGECCNFLGRVQAYTAQDWKYTNCNGKCCVDCSDRFSCPYVCEAARAKVKADRAQQKADDAKRREESDRALAVQREKDKRAMIRSAKRLVAAAEAAHLGDRVFVDCKAYSYDTKPTVGQLRKIANGDLGNAPISATAYLPDRTRLVALAKDLGCSTDYLCGLSDELRPSVPSPGWQTGRPTEQGEYVAKFDIFEGEKPPMKMIVCYNPFSGKWHFPKTLDTIGAACVGWIKLPDNEEDAEC